jgi:hypothetical protein
MLPPSGLRGGGPLALFFLWISFSSLLNMADADKKAKDVSLSEMIRLTERGGFSGPDSPFGPSDSLPVYRSDQSDFRQPFCILRLSPGRGLFDAGRDFHHGQRTSPQESRALEFRELLGRFIDLCQAVSQAERLCPDDSRNVPGQLLVGCRGEVVCVERPDAGAKESVSNGIAFRSTLPGAPSAPAARVQRDTSDSRDAPDLTAETGAHRNVYNLGVALHYLLNGCWPSGGRRLARALRETPTEQTCVETAKPRDVHLDDLCSLRAICDRAMSPRPSERPASAGELACAVRTWRDGEGLQVFYELVRDTSLRSGQVGHTARLPADEWVGPTCHPHSGQRRSATGG